MIQMGSEKAYLNQSNIDFREEIDTNIFTVSFSDIVDTHKNQKIHSGDPLYCQYCKGVLNKFSNLNLLSKSGSSSQFEWNCEFCSYVNLIQIDTDDIPENEETFYLIQPQIMQQSQSSQKSSITFCIDISGSMSTTTEIKGNLEYQKGFCQQEYEMLKEFIEPGTDSHYLNQLKSTSYISRKQCLLQAIEQQIQTLKQQNQDKVVGLITFNNEVLVYGDGSQQPIKFSESQLSQDTQMRSVLSRCSKQMMQNPIKQQADKLINIFHSIQENGQTALGPALISALELAKVGKPGSMIIVCTDGLANLGLGALDCESNKKFYQDLGQMAVEKGIIISLVTIKGEGCKIDILGELVEKTNGIVTRVNPEKISQDFADIINDVVIGTKVELKVILHKALKFRREDNVQKNNNTLKKYIGNITKSTLQTFEYQLKSQQELQKEKIDIKGLKQIPFQIRITYTNLKGDKMMKVVTKYVQTTQDIVEAEKQVKVEVIHKRIAQKTAQIAKKGNYEEAQIYNQNWNQYLQNNPHINSNQINQKKNQNYQKHSQKLSNVLKKQETRKQKSTQFQAYQQNDSSTMYLKNFNSQQVPQTTNTNPKPQIQDISKSKFTKPPIWKDNNINKTQTQQQQSTAAIEPSALSKKQNNKIKINSISTIDQKSNKQNIKIIETTNQSSESDEDQDFATMILYEKAKF